MIQKIKVTNHLGEILTLDLRSPEKSGFFIRGIEGLGPSKSMINTTEVLSADGSFYNSSRITSRNIVFDLGFYNDGIDSIETIRQRTYKYFPMKKQIQIEAIADNRSGFTSGYVETNEPDIFSKDSGSHISVLCPSSFFYGSSVIQTIFSGTGANFEFPFENPSLTLKLIEFGLVFINTSGTVVYDGDEETGVTININFIGSVNDLSIFNITNGQTMIINSAIVTAISGSNFVAGDKVIISTAKGNKYIYLIRGGIYYNILNALGSIADWFTIDRGDNVFTYTAGSGLSNIQLMIEHRTVYGGI